MVTSKHFTYLKFIATHSFKVKSNILTVSFFKDDSLIHNLKVNVPVCLGMSIFTEMQHIYLHECAQHLSILQNKFNLLFPIFV